MAITHSIDLKQKDGTVVTHTSHFLDFHHEADGVVAVLAAVDGKVGAMIPDPACSGTGSVSGAVCSACGGSGHIKDEDTRSWHSFYDTANLDEAAITKHVQDHVKRVCELHVARKKAAAHLATLLAANPTAT